MPLTDLLTAQDLPSLIPLASDATAEQTERHALLSLYRPVQATFGFNSVPGNFSLKAEVPASGSFAVLETVCHGQRFEWFLSELPDLGSWKPEFSGLDIRLLPEEIALALLDVVLESPLRALEKMGIALRLDRLKIENSEPLTSDIGWEIAFPTLPSHWRGFLRTEAAGMKLLKDVFETVAPELAPGQEGHRINLYQEWGYQILSAETFEKLKLNDLILLNDSELQAQQGLLRVGSNFRAKTKLQGTQWNIVAPVRENLGSSAGEVRLGVSSYGLSRSLGEIHSLDLTTDLGFSPQPEGRVLIWSDNQIIAEGEWMTLGTASAVRIVETKQA